MIEEHTSWLESNSYPFFAANALAIPTDSWNAKKEKRQFIQL